MEASDSRKIGALHTKTIGVQSDIASWWSHSILFVGLFLHGFIMVELLLWNCVQLYGSNQPGPDTIRPASFTVWGGSASSIFFIFVLQYLGFSFVFWNRVSDFAITHLLGFIVVLTLWGPCRTTCSSSAVRGPQDDQWIKTSPTKTTSSSWSPSCCFIVWLKTTGTFVRPKGKAIYWPGSSGMSKNPYNEWNLEKFNFC